MENLTMKLFVFVVMMDVVRGSELGFEEACFCQCRPDFKAFNENTNKSEGNCEDEWNGRRWCYITPESAKHCNHKEWWEPAQSHWSLDACYTPVLTEPPCDVEHQTCTVNDPEDFHNVYLACFKSRHAEIGLNLDCNERIQSSAYGPMRPCECVGFPERFLGRDDRSVGCVAPANSDRVDTTSSTDALGAIKTKRTWKARRQCNWRFFSNQNKWKCVRQ